MPQSSRQETCACHFEMRYEHISHPAMQALERRVLGCSYGGTSWTTKTQADEIPSLLALDSNTKLLDIGSGTGWPGLYMATLSGCELTLLDIPVHALQQARERAVQDNVDHHINAVTASGAALPFASASYSAIEHSDVLCCLPEKVEMLEECRRVAVPGAKMLFYVIAPAPGLSESELDFAIEAGPPFVEIPADYPALLRQTGWQLLETKNLTAEYHTATVEIVAGLEEGAEALAAVMGDDIYADQLTRRRLQVGAIEQGLLVRQRYLAEAV